MSDLVLVDDRVCDLSHLSQNQRATHRDLLAEEVLLETRSHSPWGGAVTAQMYIPRTRETVWSQLTNYPRWQDFFPDITTSQVIAPPKEHRSGRGLRLYQAASKKFLMLSVDVEIYLQVFEVTNRDLWQRIQFCLEQGSFSDFSADLKLQDYAQGTLLTYSVQATPTILVPSLLIQQAIRFDLPANMHHMRQVLCQSVSA